ncbi:Uma2 family endonuclease [Trichothermofontia sichuanensis B231]|uniref:Uma2 family endonuclease n=1 Tax=Trichothermofontia sichuanensis TaxID=3045816 RepID=UPI00224767AC|nr:Uma2 family endonuclease [Trichothermofontia sichuanensis]UZQ52845.1 Uma2 family endonuclease [Trichothermofontia sichuanensis B231]
MTTLTLDLRSTLELTDEQFVAICRHNPDLRLERSARGELIIMPPTGGEAGRRNSKLGGQLWHWNEQYQLGEVFDSSTGFKLPNGAIRAPDAAWVHRDRWQALTPEQREKFVPLCPDFVIELQSSSDSLEEVRAKMCEYQENGLKLGWLIDPTTATVAVYREQRSPELLLQPDTLSGELILPGWLF